MTAGRLCDDAVSIAARSSSVCAGFVQLHSGGGSLCDAVRARAKLAYAAATPTNCYRVRAAAAGTQREDPAKML